jgi:hypothetical protein
MESRSSCWSVVATPAWVRRLATGRCDRSAAAAASFSHCYVGRATIRMMNTRLWWGSVIRIYKVALSAAIRILFHRDEFDLRGVNYRASEMISVPVSGVCEQRMNGLGKSWWCKLKRRTSNKCRLSERSAVLGWIEKTLGWHTQNSFFIDMKRLKRQRDKFSHNGSSWKKKNHMKMFYV